MSSQRGFFDVDERLTRLSALGDRLEGYAGAVDFEIFRADLERALGYRSGEQGGRPPYDPVMMFKILIVQTQPASRTSGRSSSSTTGSPSCDFWV